jgi:hypothetical protein
LKPDFHQKQIKMTLDLSRIEIFFRALYPAYKVERKVWRPKADGTSNRKRSLPDRATLPMPWASLSFLSFARRTQNADARFLLWHFRRDGFNLARIESVGMGRAVSSYSGHDLWGGSQTSTGGGSMRYPITNCSYRGRWT